MARDNNFLYISDAANSWDRLPKSSSWANSASPSGTYYLQKFNGTAFDEKTVTAVSGRALGFDASLNPVMFDVSLSTHTHSTFVPYTGSTSNFDLGPNSLTVDTNTLFVDSVNHNVGIGTVTPLAANLPNGSSAPKGLEIYGNTLDALLRFATSGSSIGSDFWFDTSANEMFIDQRTSALRFRTNTNSSVVEAMKLFSNGKLHIGTTTEQDAANTYTKLFVNGNIMLENNYYVKQKDTTTGQIGLSQFNGSNELVYGQRLSGTGSYPVRFYNGTSQAMHIDSAGKIGINTTTPNEMLQVNGKISFNGNYKIGYGTVTGASPATGITIESAVSNAKFQIGDAGEVLFYGTQCFFGYADRSYPTDSTKSGGFYKAGGVQNIWSSVAGQNLLSIADNGDIAVDKTAYNTYTSTSTTSNIPAKLYINGKLDINYDTLRLRQTKTPASAAATGNAGDICYDTSYIYICTAVNTWKRAALTTW